MWQHAFKIILDIGKRLFENPCLRKAILEKQEDLLKSSLTLRAEIEFTTRCNLRCVYCYRIFTGDPGYDMDLRCLPMVVKTLKRRGVLAVGVQGDGETTIMKNWHYHCSRMLNEGIDLYITSNMTKELRDDEAATLARFLIIQISCDTADPAFFRNLRRGGDLKTILLNMAKIRSQAMKYNLPGPIFWWHAVVSDKTVFGLEELARLGLAQGVRMFSFLNLTKYPVREESEQLCPVTSMPLSQVAQLPDLFRRVFSILRRGGAGHMTSTLLDDIHETLRQNAQREPSQTERACTIQRPGMTRDCLDPWIFTKLGVDGAVRPCCVGAPAGFLKGDNDLEQILNNEKMMEYREGLLTGKLVPECKVCLLRGWTDLETIYLKVSLISAFRRLPEILHRRGLLLPVLIRSRR
jgi:hypothetical protein